MKKAAWMLVLAAIGMSGCGTPGEPAAPASVAEQTSDSEEAAPVKTENPTFRNTTWGMSREQIIAAEGSEPAGEQEGAVLYKDQVSGLNVVVYYNLIDDQLVSSAYMLQEDHMNENQYISDYDRFQDSLTDRYGEPDRDDEIWKGDLYRDEPRSNWGMALITGDLQLYSSWETGDTSITLNAIGDNFKANMAILYEGLKYQDMIKQNTKVKDDGKF
ncbi:hypothetical protein QWJ34_08975 [Saccharibacillus sp. CPCC 101409]|uniref:hypothetical protein n=1 Tax=Saccharibacillus sp. CPCC 101409 TaxID=3058041 RepID=UPI002672F432|nr:hypothetical protein [Saccharibacillus sp. CPCC 101409]MDO3409893.1 hypothetical protein [Saccharibacillus sp. CPCC 101409]